MVEKHWYVGLPYLCQFWCLSSILKKLIHLMWHSALTTALPSVLVTTKMRNFVCDNLEVRPYFYSTSPTAVRKWYDLHISITVQFL
jgi:hypothetical protein